VVPLVRTFSYHCRKRYGKAVGKIPLDVGITCPNRQKGGCIYCRAASFTPRCLDGEKDIQGQLQLGKEQLLAGRFKTYFGYFQQETVTALPVQKLLPLFETVLQDSDCVGLIISTRPDYLSADFTGRLAQLIEQTNKECLIELGLQSIHSKSLQLLNRNHSLSDFVTAAAEVKKYRQLQLGAHLIFGIPGESRRDMLGTVEWVCELGVDAMKLHHLQVIAETPLHELYLRGEVKVFTLEEYLELLMQVLPMIPQHITLHRLWSTSHPSLLVAPKWHILTSDLSRQLLERMEKRSLFQGCAAS